MASTQYDCMSREELVRELEAARKMTRNREMDDERITRQVTSLLRYTKEVEQIPSRMENLHKRIRDLVHHCDIIATDLTNISSDMKSVATNKLVFQSISSVVGIVGGTVVLAAATGGVSLVFSFVGFGASATGLVSRVYHGNQTEELSRKALRCQMEANFQAGEFLEEYNILAEIRDRFAKSELFESPELIPFRNDAFLITDVLNCIVEVIRTAHVNNEEFVGKFNRLKDNFVLKIVTKRQKAEKEEDTCKFILTTIRDRMSKPLPDDIRKAFDMGTDLVIGGLCDPMTCMTGVRTGFHLFGVAANYLAQAAATKNSAEIVQQLGNATKALKSIKDALNNGKQTAEIIAQIATAEKAIEAASKAANAGNVVSSASKIADATKFIQVANDLTQKASILNVATDITTAATSTEEAGRMVADSASKSAKYANFVKGVAVVTIILDIVNIVVSIYSYKKEIERSEQLAEQAQLLRENIDKLKEINVSIKTFRKKFQDVIDAHQ